MTGINMMKASQDAFKKEDEKQKHLEKVQREHDAAMQANPDQRRAIEALDNAQTVANLNLDQQIEQLEHQLSVLRQQRAAQRAPEVSGFPSEPIVPVKEAIDDDVEKKDEDVDAPSERKQPESNQSKHSTGKKFR